MRISDWSSDVCSSDLFVGFKNTEEAMIQDRETSSLPQRLSDTVRRWSAEAPDSLALSQAGTTFTYRQLADALDQPAAELRVGAIRPGDRLMTVALSRVSHMDLRFAAPRHAAWGVHLHTGIV